MTTVNTAPDFGQANATKAMADLEKSITQNWSRHYLLRRLPIIGVLYSLSTGMILLLGYLTLPKDASLAKINLTWLTLIQWQDYLFFSSTMLVICIFTFGKGGEKSDSESKCKKIMLNLGILVITILPLLLPITEIMNKVTFIFFWGIALCALSWQINRTFGYTRIWARGKFYKRRLELLEIEIKECNIDEPTAGAKRFAIMEQWIKEIYLDSVGDTFYFLDRLTKKPE